MYSPHPSLVEACLPYKKSLVWCCLILYPIISSNYSKRSTSSISYFSLTQESLVSLEVGNVRTSGTMRNLIKSNAKMKRSDLELKADSRLGNRKYHETRLLMMSTSYRTIEDAKQIVSNKHAGG